MSPIVAGARRWRRVAAPLAVAVLGGCSKMAIDGVVVDANGDPMSGARVSVIGTPCSAETDAEGKFSAECQPGTYQLVISAEGYTTTELEVEAPERDRYDVGRQLLIKIPESKGLFRFVDNVYEPMVPGMLARTKEKTSDGLARRYCLDTTQSTANPVPSGVVPFFDNESTGWRPFRLDADGCAYRDVRDAQAKWHVVYKEKPEYEEYEIQQGKRIVRIQVEPGNYFIADWDKGFFTPSDDDKNSFTGFWVQVPG